MIKYFIFSFALLLPECLFSQNNFEVLHQEKTDLGCLTNYCLVFSTQTDVDRFYNELSKELGPANRKHLSWTWDSLKNELVSLEQIKLTISLTFINGREVDYKRISIRAENGEGQSVLKPGTRTYKRLRKYIEEKIENAAQTL